MQNKKYDILIIGCGPAGMTAAIYAARAGKKAVVLDCEGIGGQMAKSPLIENFPGFQSISGSALAFKIFDQMTALGVDFDMDSITSIQKRGKLFQVDTAVCSYCVSAIIAATGAVPIELNVPGGREYAGKGIHYCVACDGPLYRDKSVLVVGSGNSGAQYALELSHYCKSVTICEIASHLCCEKTMEDLIRNSRINLLLSSAIHSVYKNPVGQMSVDFINGDNIVVDGIFVAIGQRPSTGIFKELLLMDSKGYIIANQFATSVPGIFVAGDCQSKKVRQAITAASDGAQAALAAVHYINDLGGAL